MLGRYSPDFFGFGGCGCCTQGGQVYYTPAQKHIVVIGHNRVTTGGVTRNLTAFDYSFNQLWTYDMGLTSTSHEYIAGKPSVDGAGNVYVPYCGAILTGGTQTADFGCIKLDKNGVLQWNYDAGIGACTGNGTADGSISASCFDTLGNIIFGTARAPTNVVAVKLSPAGALVQNYDSSGWGGFSGATGGNCCDCVEVDASNNVYLVAPDGNFSRMFKMSSGGTFISQVQVGFAQGSSTCGCHIRGMKADRVNGKLYMSNGLIADNSGLYHLSGILFRRWDMAGMTNDWDFTLSNMAVSGSIDLSHSNPSTGGRDLGFFPGGNVTMGCGRISDSAVATPPAGLTLANAEQCLAAGFPVEGAEYFVSPSTNQTPCLAAVCDIITGNVFGVLQNNPTTAFGILWNVTLGGQACTHTTANAFHGQTVGCGTYT